MAEGRRYHVTILLISFAALLLEISYTRFISFKLFYYYTYLIIGLALLGIGSGGVFVAISSRLRRMDLDRILIGGCVLGAASVLVGYLLIAYTPVDTRSIWTGDAIGLNVGRLMIVCLSLFGTFLFVGVMIATLFGRMPDDISGLYFADLIGAGIACAFVVPAIKYLGPPATISAAGVILALTGVWLARGRAGNWATAGTIAAAVLGITVVFPGLLPDPKTDAIKTIRPETETLFSKWNPVFRIDVTSNDEHPDVRYVHHDGLWGSAVHRFDGDLSKLSRFDKQDRSFPFRVLDDPPGKVLIIGAAGGHEIIASLYFEAGQINAVELNPVTVSLLTTHLADFSGHLHENPKVNLINDDGRSYLARDSERYDLIFFVAPDSYSAMNAATAGAFVLSESYLYTKEMILESLTHLTDDGIICMQFGEIEFSRKPNRTARYLATAREAFHELGIEDHAAHMLVATSHDFIPVSTILLKRTAFTKSEVDRFLENMPNVTGAVGQHAPGHQLQDGPVNKIINLPDSSLDAWLAEHNYDVSPITDDAPFFWHFSRFGDVIEQFGEKHGGIDPEDQIGERLLLLLLAISVVFAAIFLLLPFVAIRQEWAKLPMKGASAVYFSSLGLGFMFFEVCLIQKLTLFLGYPTYSLTVTLMSILIFTGIGSLMSERYAANRNAALLTLLAVIVGLTVFYQFGLDALTGAMQSSPLTLRVAMAFGILAPLGVCLGAFMPLGLRTVAALSPHADEYVAWGWAVNGFFSVIGSVLTTVLSMTFGFRVVLLLGLAVYTLAVFTLRAIPMRLGR